MSRKVLSVSLPEGLFEEYKRLVQEEGKGQSELFREMIRLYRQEKEEREFFKIQRRVSQTLRKKGIFTEEEVEKIISEGR